MVLAGALARFPGELRADFQRFYGLNLDGLGADYTYLHAADLAAHLPPESALARAQSPESEWTATQYMLRSIEYHVRLVAWQGTEDGRKGRNAPRPIPTPADAARVRRKAEATDAGMIASALGLEF